MTDAFDALSPWIEQADRECADEAVSESYVAVITKPADEPGFGEVPLFASYTCLTCSERLKTWESFRAHRELCRLGLTERTEDEVER